MTPLSVERQTLYERNEGISIEESDQLPNTFVPAPAQDLHL